MKNLFLTLTIMAASLSALAESVHIYKCHGGDAEEARYVVVDAYPNSNTAFEADDLCRDIDPVLGANGINAVSTIIENIEGIKNDNTLLGSIHSHLASIQNKRSQNRNMEGMWQEIQGSRRGNGLDPRCWSMDVVEIYNNSLERVCF